MSTENEPSVVGPASEAHIRQSLPRRSTGSTMFGSARSGLARMPSSLRSFQRDLRVGATTVVGHDHLCTDERLLTQRADRMRLNSVLLRAIFGNAHPRSLEGFAVEDGAIPQRQPLGLHIYFRVLQQLSQPIRRDGLWRDQLLS